MIPVTPGLTNRQRVEMTTGKGTCGEACHAVLFNPLGYAFENYDAIGEYRTMDVGQTVDAADSYAFDGQLQSFKQRHRAVASARRRQGDTACYVQNMMSYLHGRQLWPTSRRRSTTTPGCLAPEWSLSTIWSWPS